MTLSSPRQRLDALRAVLAADGLDACIVRSTDRYLNEYVPRAESAREWLTGFCGSLGDAMVSRDHAWLYVDGRYHTQADREVDLDLWTVVKGSLSNTNEVACAETLRAWAETLPAGASLRVGYEPQRYSVAAWEAFVKEVGEAPIVWVATETAWVDRVRPAPRPEVVGDGVLHAVDEGPQGRTVAEKHALVAAWLRDKRAEALVVTRLDEIAWLTNLRAQEMPYQATFRGAAVVTAEALAVSVHGVEVPEAVRAARPGVHFVDDAALLDFARGAEKASAVGVRRVALDPAGTPVATREALEAAGITVVSVASPVVKAKAHKTPAEMDAMQSAMARADRVVYGAQRWLQARVAEGTAVTERGFAQEVERRFLEAGATHLSFKVIAAFGEHGAIVHHLPSDETVARPGDLVLLDTGCYFAEGFATDLTRTFFVGTAGQLPSEAQRRMYTLVLKAAVAGMSARLPVGASGSQLDGITRSPLWQEGCDYLHGTGHGVGINVHEAPPGINKRAAMALEEGHVFSIEPGLYQEGIGGVRIENLCTVRPDLAHPGYLCVTPLTFAPLDHQLIDDALLTESERRFVSAFQARAVVEGA